MIRIAEYSRHRLSVGPTWARAWMLLLALLAAAPAAGGDSAVETCTLESVELDERGAEALLLIGVDGNLGAMGASIEPGIRIVLFEFSGCVLSPELSELAFSVGLVSAVRFPPRAY